MSNDRIIKSGDIEKMLKEEIRQAIIVLYNYDVVTGQYVDKELQKEKMIKEIAGKWEGKYSEETIREAMNNNKAREYTSPLIEELLNEVTPEEMERTNREMENMDREFNKTKLNYIANTLKEAVNRMEYTGDMSDLGNEIGVTVGHAYENMTEENINDFISGFRHGVSLTNGTH
jgi:hypothetical protein